MNISPTMLALIIAGAGFLGAIVPSLLALRIARLTKESEDRKQYRDLLFKVGFDWWKYEQDSSGVRFPFEEYLARMDAFYATFVEENHDEDKARKKRAILRTFLAESSKRLAKHRDSRSSG